MNKTLFLIIFILFLLLLTALVTFNIGPDTRRRQREAYRIFPRDTAHLFGWMGLLIFAASALYSALKRDFSKTLKTWIFVHCIMGILSIIFVVFHIINKNTSFKFRTLHQLFCFPTHGSNSYKRNLRSIYESQIHKVLLETLHIPLTIIFYFTLAFHILKKMSFLW